MDDNLASKEDQARPKKHQRRITKFLSKRFDPKRWLGLDHIIDSGRRIISLVQLFRKEPDSFHECDSFEALMRRHNVQQSDIKSLVRYHCIMSIVYAVAIAIAAIYVYTVLFRRTFYLEALISSLIFLPLIMLLLKHLFCRHVLVHKKVRLSFFQWAKYFLRIG